MSMMCWPNEELAVEDLVLVGSGNVGLGLSESPMIARIRAMNSAKGNRDLRKRIVIGVLSLVVLAISLYAAVGLVSLAEVSEGVDHAYSAFWHGPWKALFQLLGWA